MEVVFENMIPFLKEVFAISANILGNVAFIYYARPCGNAPPIKRCLCWRRLPPDVGVVAFSTDRPYGWSPPTLPPRYHH
jgi:hypothetical protein